MKIIEIIFDSLFPPRESELIVRGGTDAAIRLRYNTHLSAGCICLSEYRDPLIQALITENKFHNNTTAKRALAVLLDIFIKTQSSSLILIPVPLGPKRLRERGYNQVSELLKQLDWSQTVQIKEQLCSRKKETQAQVSLQRNARLQNVAGAFQVDAALVAELRDKTIVIIDDVCTTGATLHAVRSAFQSYLHPSCTIICVALAH